MRLLEFLSDSYTMDIFRAVADFLPTDNPRYVLSFYRGEMFESLEHGSRRFRAWWGVRRLSDNAIGYVPAKYLRVRRGF